MGEFITGGCSSYAAIGFRPPVIRNQLVAVPVHPLMTILADTTTRYARFANDLRVCESLTPWIPALTVGVAANPAVAALRA